MLLHAQSMHVPLPPAGVGAVSKESVTLAHFLDRADALLAHADHIRALDAQV
jgi:hypothetical protein